MNIKANILFPLLFILISITSLAQMKVLDVPGLSAPSGSDWCWAVVVAEVSNYYGNSTQICEIVESARVNLTYPYKDRGNVNCCSVPVPDSCYGPEWASNIRLLLSFEGIQATRNWMNLSLDNVIDNIEDNKPIIAHATAQRKHPDGSCCRTAGHVMVVTGYNGGDIHYNDGGSSWITPYELVISGENMGIYKWQWTDGSTLMFAAPSPLPCPKDIGIIENIIESRNIKAKESIIISSQVGNNITVNLKAGSNIIIDNNFSIPLGSTLIAEISSNPCQ